MRIRTTRYLLQRIWKFPDTTEKEKRRMERRENICGGILFRCRALLSPNFCSCFDPCVGKVYFWGLCYIVGKQLFSRLSLWKEPNKKGIILLICGVCFRLNFD